MHRFELVGFLGALTLVLTLSSVSLARPPFEHGAPPRDPGAFIEEHAEALGLDDETLAAIREIVEQSRGKGDQLHAKLRESHEQMRELLAQSDPDKADVMRQVDVIGEVETELHRHRLATMLEIRALLSPEQREAMTRLREESRGRWKRALLEDCEADLEALCPDVEDRWARKECLREQRDKLSAECRDAIEAARCGRHGFHAGCPKHCGSGDCERAGAGCPHCGADCPMRHGPGCKHGGADCPMHRGPGCPHCGADCPMHRGPGASERPEGASSEPGVAGDAI